MGKSELDQAKVDMICECMADCMAPVRAIFGEQDEKKKVSKTSTSFAFLLYELQNIHINTCLSYVVNERIWRHVGNSLRMGDINLNLCCIL